MKRLAAVVVACALACTKPPVAPPAPTQPVADADATAPARRDLGPFVAVGPSADRVPRGDGPVKPDGTKDFAFRVRVAGEVAAIVVMSSDIKGNPVGGEVWDTYRGETKLPEKVAKQLKYDTGKWTWTLGVFDASDRLVNPEGELPQGTSFHDETLTIYLGDGGFFTSGYTVTIMVVRPDGTIDRATTSVV